MSGTLKTSRLLLPLAILVLPGNADPASQSQMNFTPVVAGTWAADWTGVAGKTYFFQWSNDLENWYYAPIIDFGEGDHSYGCASTSPGFFVRLHHTDIYGSLEEARSADFDNDGLSNIFEVTYGYNPFQTTSTAGGPDASLDPDEDGLGNYTEHTSGSNPMVKDNPIVQLEVIVE
ncbi:MAG: hypothetical protein WCJ66_11835 [Verrucomicrobiota bacterium]